MFSTMSCGKNNTKNLCKTILQQCALYKSQTPISKLLAKETHINNEIGVIYVANQ